MKYKREERGKVNASWGAGGTMNSMTWGWGGWGEALVTQMELKLCVIGRDPCKCKGPVVEPHRHHRPVWKSAEREEQWDVRLESGKE